MNTQKAMARQAMDQKVAKNAALKHLDRPIKGWIRAIRKSIGMTTQQLAKRMDITPSRILAMEKDEVLGNLKISTLERIARAMNCRLVYAFVPEKSFETLVQEQAEKKARQIIAQAVHTMGLEAQAIHPKQTQEQFNRLVEDLLNRNPARLWDEP